MLEMDLWLSSCHLTRAEAKIFQTKLCHFGSGVGADDDNVAWWLSLFPDLNKITKPLLI